MTKLIPPVVDRGAMAGMEQPVISVDDEVSLRPFRPNDARAVVQAFSTPDIQHYHFRRVDSDAEAMQWILVCAEGWRSKQSATWAIVSRARDNVFGRVTIYTSLEDGHGEVSYWVLPSARGHGVATRACVAATEWAHRLGIHRVQLQHSTQNESSSIGRHTAIGGRDALADDVLSSASSLGMTTERISGATRFATATAIAEARGFTADAPAERVIVIEGQVGLGVVCGLRVRGTRLRGSARPSTSRSSGNDCWKCAAGPSYHL